MIKTKDSRFCSIGWFKNPEREEFAKFSLPIYQDKSMVILTLEKQDETIGKINHAIIRIIHQQVPE